MRIALIAFILFSFTRKELCSQVRYESKIFSTVDVTTFKYGQNTTYDGTSQELFLDVYSGRGDNAKNRACVIFCFGGAFVSGNKTSPEIYYFANYLSQLGYACASIDYRLDKSSNLTSIENESKSVIRAVQDAKAAIRFLKNKSDELGLDSNLIFIGGTSAGGIIALTHGYSQYIEFTPAFRSIIDSLGGWEGKSNNLTNSSSVIGLFNFSGALFDTSHIQKNDLPVYLNHATGDKTVPFYQGLPLNGESKTLVYGSGSIFQTAKNRGNYSIIDSFNTEYHPSFATPDLLKNFEILNSTSIALKNFFLYVLKSKGNLNSISNKTKSEITIYPNPTNDYISIYSPNLIHEDIILYNTLGEQVNKYPKGQSTMNISALSEGLYYLKIEDNVYKIIKE